MRRKPVQKYLRKGRMKARDTISAPPPGYRKKIVNEDGDCPLEKTYSGKQIEKKIAFYEELNRRRDTLRRQGETVERKFAIYGFEDTTTVRVYMRETIEKIAAELFFSDFRVTARNIYPKKETGEIDKDHGYVEATVRATKQEIEALFEYIRPGASYCVYDGERATYVAGETRKSLFIITKPDGCPKPENFWRMSRSFISRIEEL